MINFTDSTGQKYRFYDFVNLEYSFYVGIDCGLFGTHDHCIYYEHILDLGFFNSALSNWKKVSYKPKEFRQYLIKYFKLIVFS